MSLHATLYRGAARATLELADVQRYTPPADSFDVVVLAFVLHELPLDDVPAVVRRAAGGLASGGRVVVMDFAAPKDRGRIWRGVLGAMEGRSLASWLALDIGAAMRAAGLASVDERALAGGRVSLVVGRSSTGR